MTITIVLNVDNAAFDDSGEVPRILRDLASRWDHELDRELSSPLRLHDYNGNTVGRAVVEED